MLYTEKSALRYYVWFSQIQSHFVTVDSHKISHTVYHTHLNISSRYLKVIIASIISTTAKNLVIIYTVSVMSLCEGNVQGCFEH